MVRASTTRLKAQIRREIALKRLAMSEDKCLARSLAIEQNLFSLPEFVARKTIAFYMALDREVQTRGMIRQAIGLGKQALIPKINGEEGHFVWSEIRDIDREVTRGTFGILEPREHYLRIIPCKAIELVIVPGVAFDVEGRRIGFGRGYYDRMLAQLEETCFRVGLAFELQIVPEIPHLEHDIPVHKLITEERLISCPPGRE